MSELPPFSDLPLDPSLLAACAKLGFNTPTPIQAAVMPSMLEGRDVIGRARTGSGKTAAFALPMLERLKAGGRKPRALVLAPTRELAQQTSRAIRSMCGDLPIHGATVYGGAPYGPQVTALRKATVVVATPGRLIDLMDRDKVDLSQVEVVVLDEADEMLRMGFIDDVDHILSAVPQERQVALFSATMPNAIRRVAASHLVDPVEVQVEDKPLSVDHIEQIWIHTPHKQKLALLIRVLAALRRGTTLVFARTKADCGRASEALAKVGIRCAALNSDLSQPARERVVRQLRDKHLEVVVATDIAARGLDVDHITHVINLDLPTDTESYVHRIGRTGRAGAKGRAISFVTPIQQKRIRGLARELGVNIARISPPSDDVLARRQKERFIQRMDEAGTSAAGLVEDLVAEGRSHEDIAVAALSMLMKAEGGAIEAAPPDEDQNESELYVPAGKKHGIRPGDLVGALANEANIPGVRIGRITVRYDKSFICMPEVLAAQVLDRVDRVELRGRMVRVARSQR